MTTPLNDRLQHTIRQDVKSMHAYAIQPSAGFIKLDAMENPFVLPPELQRELGKRLGRVAINRYPGQCTADVVARLSAFVWLPAGCKLILGNGSDELIDILSVACNRPGATLLAPLPGFVMYEMSAKLRGLNFVGVPLTADFELDEDAMLAAIEQHKPGAGVPRRTRTTPPAICLTKAIWLTASSRRSTVSQHWPGGVRRGVRAVFAAADLHGPACRSHDNRDRDAHGIEAGTGRHPPRLHVRRLPALLDATR